MHISRGKITSIALATFFLTSTISVQACDNNVGILLSIEKSKRLNHDEYVNKIIHNLDKNKTTNLDLNIQDNTRNEITNQDTLNIFKSLKLNTSLISIKLKSGSINKNNFIEILENLIPNNTLKELNYIDREAMDIGYTYPLNDPQVIKKIKDILLCNYSLTKLNLGFSINNPIIISTLKRNEKLNLAEHNFKTFSLHYDLNFIFNISELTFGEWEQALKEAVELGSKSTVEYYLSSKNSSVWEGQEVYASKIIQNIIYGYQFSSNNPIKDILKMYLEKLKK